MEPDNVVQLLNEVLIVRHLAGTYQMRLEIVGMFDAVSWRVPSCSAMS